MIPCRRKARAIILHGDAMPNDIEVMPISRFKATCLAVLERVRRTGKPILVTRRGQPLAQVVPPPPAPTHGWLGCLRGTGRIAGDVVSPAMDEDRWEALAR
jgi:prevent-host-death family protein